MSHQTIVVQEQEQPIVIQEQDVTLVLQQITTPSRDPLQTSKIRLPVGGGPLVFCDENDNLLLTLDVNGNIISEKGFVELSEQVAPTLSAAGKARLYLDSTLNQVLLSEDGGAYAPIGGSTDPLQTSKILLPVGGGPLEFSDESDTLLLTLDVNGNIISAKGFVELSEQAAPALSVAGKARLYLDSTSNKVFLSEDGGAYTPLIDGGAGDVIGPAGATDEAVARYNTATGKLIQNSLVTINDSGNIVTTGTVTGGAASFTTAAAGTVPLIAKGAASQTAPLQEWQNSSGVALFAIGPTGFIRGGITQQINFDPDNDGSNEWFMTSGRIVALGNTLRLFTSGAIDSAATLALSGTQGFSTNSNVADSAGAVGFSHTTSILDKDTFTPGALHSKWLDAGADKIMTLTPGGDLMIFGDLDHDGSGVGFYGTAPAAQSSAYTPTNVTPDRAFDADTVAVAELADVVGTMIADLQATGLFG